MLVGKIRLLANNSSKRRWLIDNGATDHICSDMNSFIHYKLMIGDNEYIVVLDGREIQIFNTGSVQITEDMVLHNVLHVPHFLFHLLYVQKLCKDMSCAMVFHADKCFLQDLLQKERLIHLGKVQGGL